MRHFKISISLQISVFLIIVAFIPVAVMMALRTYEKQQLDMMERSNVQQGRLVASALVSNLANVSAPDGKARPVSIDADYAYKLLENMNGQFDCRIRIINKNKTLIADSSRMDIKPGDDVSEKTASRTYQSQNAEEKESFIYRLFSLPFRVYRKLFKPPHARLYDTADFYINKKIFDGVEVNQALE